MEVVQYIQKKNIYTPKELLSYLQIITAGL